MFQAALHKAEPFIFCRLKKTNHSTWMQLKGQLCQQQKRGLFAVMKCNNRTIFRLLMQSYKRGTWIALAVKEHLPDLETLQASVFTLFSCVTHLRCIQVPRFFFFFFGDVLQYVAGGVSSLFQSHKKPRGLGRKQLLRNEHWLEGQGYLSLPSLRDCSINTVIDLRAS